MIVDAAVTIAGSLVGSTLTGQAITSTGNTLSTNVIDCNSGGTGGVREMGEGNDGLFLRLLVTQVFNNATSVEFQVIAHDDPAQSVNVTVIGSTGAVALASLTNGARFACQFNPRIASKGQRYLSGRWVVTGASPTTGSIYADIGTGIADFKAYPMGFSVQ